MSKNYSSVMEYGSRTIAKGAEEPISEPFDNLATLFY